VSTLVCFVDSSATNGQIDNNPYNFINLTFYFDFFLEQKCIDQKN